MTVTTEETVTVDGMVLNTLAYNIATYSGRMGIPGHRGDNVEVPFRQGAVWQPKMHSQRVENWTMWIVGADVDGMVPAHGSRAEFNEHLAALKQLFGVRHRLLTVEKKMAMAAGLLELHAEAECVGTMEPEAMAGGTRAVFTAEMNFPDPYWYGDEIEEVVTSAGATITNPGNVRLSKMVLRLVGPLSQPVLTNTTASPDVWVAYEGEIAGGVEIELDVDQFTALQGSTNRIGLVSHQGARQWMLLDAGANVLTLTKLGGGSVGAGSVEVIYEPAYL